MKKYLAALIMLVLLPFNLVSANEEEDSEDYSQKKIYNNSCYVNNNPAGRLDEGTKGAVGCPPGSNQTFGRAANAFSARNTAMTCVFGADYYFFSHSDGKCYKYETTKINKLEREGGRWICYSSDSNDCD